MSMIAGGAPFELVGTYQVQSSRKRVVSSVRGEFLSGPELLDASIMNEALTADPRWAGRGAVRLRAARITSRTGLFESEPDVLYKKQYFEAAPGHRDMAVDIVDVYKSVALWRVRREYARRVFRAGLFERLEARIAALPVTIANEYYCHEAGHLLGIPVEEKHAAGYFRDHGKLAWPRVYVEELRADLHSFGKALAMLSIGQAGAALLYNMALRWGLEAFALANGTGSYGAVPYLLFSVLSEIGFVRTAPETALDVPDMSDAALREALRACDAHASAELTAYELGGSLVDAATRANEYFAERASNTARAETYLSLIVRAAA
jgi:hypothetical protein